MIITCPRCKESGAYSLADLRNFRAVRLICKYGLTSIGKRMQESDAYWAFVMIDLVDFICKLGIDFGDEDIESLKTLDDMLLLTTKKLSATYRPSKLEQIIFSVASEYGNYAANELKSSLY